MGINVSGPGFCPAQALDSSLVLQLKFSCGYRSSFNLDQFGHRSELLI